MASPISIICSKKVAIYERASRMPHQAVSVDKQKSSSGLPLLLTRVRAMGPNAIGRFLRAHGGCKATTDSTGNVLTKDNLRRIAANSSADRPLQICFIAAVAFPFLWCGVTQNDPTVREQVTAWWQTAPSLGSGYWCEPGFLTAAAVLSMERLCYTWVHARTHHFMTFCATPLGQVMGKTHIDVVYSLFCMNKWIQSFTFPIWWFYTLGNAWPSTIASAMSNVAREATRLQWTCLVTSVVVGQGLNYFACQALGKRGIFYGHKLGLDVLWVTGFPFNIMSHVQYTGMCIFVTCWNVFMSTTLHVAAGLFNLTAVQVFYYVYMALVEDYM